MMLIRYRLLAVAAVALFTVPAFEIRAAAKLEPKIVLQGARVVVTNVTPGQTAIVFGASQEIGTGVRLQRWQRPVTDTDRDGTVELNIPDGIPVDSIWIAVDATTGALATTAPPASRFRRVQFPGEVLRKNKDGALEWFVTGRAAIDVLVVRPHVGAWAAYAADGFDTDVDGRQDGRTVLKFENAKRLDGNAPPPRHLTHRDIVVAVDVRRLQYYTTEVSQ